MRSGLVAVVHVGNTSTDCTGWADIGWNRPDGVGLGGLVRLADTQRVHAAQNLVAALRDGGVFARHPELTVVLEEMRVNWVLPFVATLEVVFSSDYPHDEGDAEPLALYEPEIDDLDAEVRELFLGASMADCFARTGDPLAPAGSIRRGSAGR